MGIGTGPRENPCFEIAPMTCETLEFATQFIASLSGLHELHITDLDAAAETIVPTILETRKSLQALSYHAPMHRGVDGRERPCTFTTAQLDELRQKNPALSHLSIAFQLEDGEWVSVIGQDA